MLQRLVGLPGKWHRKQLRKWFVPEAITEVCFSALSWLGGCVRKPLLLISVLVIGLAILIYGLMSVKDYSNDVQEATVPAERPKSPKPVPEVVKQDCERLVQGQLVFEPSATMQQGKPSLVFARLSRGNDTNILTGLPGGAVKIENAQVSCLVQMKLDSQEDRAFQIDNVPAGRKDEQFLLANQFTEWDWRVTPLKYGTLHLLLYVTPMLHIDGVGNELKGYPQPPRVITVSPDYIYAVRSSIVANWAIYSGLLTAIILPSLYWLAQRFKRWREERAKGPAGFVRN